MSEPQLQQPRPGANVTRIATATDVREMGVVLATQNGRAARAVQRVEAKLTNIEQRLTTLARIEQRLITTEAQVDRLLKLLQSVNNVGNPSTTHPAKTRTSP